MRPKITAKYSKSKPWTRFTFLEGVSLTFKREDNEDIVAFHEGYRLMLARWLTDLFNESNPIIIVQGVTPMYNRKGKEIRGKLLVKTAYVKKLQRSYSDFKLTFVNSYEVKVSADNCVYIIESNIKSKLHMIRQFEELANTIGVNFSNLYKHNLK